MKLDCVVHAEHRNKKRKRTKRGCFRYRYKLYKWFEQCR